VSAPVQPAAPWTAAQRWTVIAAVLGSSLAFIDGSVVNVALSALQADFGADLASAQWVINAYTLLLAALILAGGALGDLYGRRRLFTLGVWIFAGSSLLCGLAPSLGVLIAARVLQGVGGALLIPGSLALINAAFADSGRGGSTGRAIGVWSSSTSLVTILGPALGGFLVDTVSWRAVFLINLPLAVLVLLSLRRIGSTEEHLDRQKARPDLFGVLLVVAGLGALTFGLIEAGSRGIGALQLGFIVAGLAILALFLVWESRSTSPMLPLSLFRSAAFSGTNLLTFLLYGALGAALFFLPLNLIGVQGYSAAAAGAALLPMSLLLAGLSGVFGGLADRIGPKWLLTAGPVLAGLGFAWLGNLGVGGGYWTHLLPPLLLLGLGMAVTVAPLTSAVMGSVGTEFSGTASGVNNAVSRAAGLIALAAFTLLLLGQFRGDLSNRLQAAKLPPAAQSAMLAQSARLAQIPIPKNLSPAQKTAASGAVKQAFASSFRSVCWWSGVLAVLGGLVGFLSLGSVKTKRPESAPS
jgi:EmrB/QacA subfamily drug resistance transporter